MATNPCHVVWLLTLHVATCSGTEPAANEALSLGSGHSSLDAKIELRLQPSVVAIGQAFVIECEWWGSGVIYNGCLREDRRLPARIVVRSADGRLHRDLLRPVVGAPKRSDAGDWTTVAAQGTVGKEIIATIMPNTTDTGEVLSGMRCVDLPPGEYYVQAIYSQRLFSLWPKAPGMSGPSFGDGDEPFATSPLQEMERPLAVSKPVRLIVTPESLTQQSTAPAAHQAIHLELRAAQGNNGRAAVEIRMVNRSANTIEVYNPFISGLLPWKCGYSLALFSEDGTLLGDLFAVSGGSSRAPDASDWVTLPPAGVVASRFEFRSGYIPQRLDGLSRAIPPGRHFLELRAHTPALSGIPASIRNPKSHPAGINDPTWGEWARGFPGEIIARSNRLELVSANKEVDTKSR